MTTTPEPVPKGAWRIVAVLTLAATFSFLDRSVLGLLVEPIKQDLGVSDRDMGLLLGFAFASFYALFGLPFGRLADLYSRMRIIQVGFVLFTVATALCGWAKSYSHLFLLRMTVGVGEATLGPCSTSILADIFPRRRLATAISMLATGIYIGAGLATVVGGAVAAFAVRHENLTLPFVGTLRPWQLVFFVVGGLGLLPLLLLFTLREPPRGTPAASGREERSAALRDVLRHYRLHARSIGGHHVAFVLLAFSGFGVGSWIPTFMIRIHGWSIAKTGFVLGINAAVMGTLGVLVGGWIADRWSAGGVADAKMRMALVSAVLWLPFGLSYPLVASDRLVFLILIPLTFVSSLGVGCHGASLQEIVPSTMRGTAAAIYVVLANLLGQGLGPWGVALCTDLLFGDEMKLPYSLLLVGGAMHLLAIAILLFTLAPFRRSVAVLHGPVANAAPAG